MTKKMRVLAAFLTTAVLCGVSLAQKPVQNINPKRHPELAEAQHLVAQANEYIEKAQVANKGDMQGHAEKARQLLVQANQELKEAAEAANAAKAPRKR